MQREIFILWNGDMTEGVVFTDPRKVVAVQTGGADGVHSDLGEFFYDNCAGVITADRITITSGAN